MNKKRLLSSLLVLCLLSSVVLPEYTLAAEVDEPQNVTLTMYSNLTDDTFISGVYKDNVFYITLNDLCEITNWKVEEETEEEVVLVYGDGVRKFVIDVGSNIMEEPLNTDSYHITMPSTVHNDVIYVSAVHFLRYIGATVHLNENSNTQFMVVKRYDIYDALTDLLTSDLGNYFWWDEVDPGDENLEKKLTNAGVVALINRNSNIFRMAIDARGIEREALEDALLSIIKNEGQGYFDEENPQLELISTTSGLIGAEADWFDLIRDAYIDSSDELGNQISDIASSAATVAGFANNVVTAVEGLKKFDDISTAQKNLLQNTILAHPEDSKTLCDGWENVFQAAQNLDGKVQSEYVANYETAQGVAKSTAYDFLNSGVGNGNPMTIAWNGAILLTQMLPFTHEMIDRKTQLYNAYNCSMIQMIANELMVQAYSDWALSDVLYSMPAQHVDAINRVKYAMILQLKSTLTTREYLIQSGFLEESYRTEMEEMNKETAEILSRVEGCKITGVNLFAAEYDDDLSWMGQLPAAERRKQIVQVNRYSYNNRTPDYMSYYTYNNQGQLIQEKTKNEYSESIYNYEYDSIGRLISKTGTSDGEYRGAETIERSYDEEGRLIMEASYKVGDNWYEVEYTYNENNRIESEHCKWYQPGDFTNAYTITYTHAYSEAANGTLTDTRAQVLDDGSIFEEVTFIYDASDRMIQGCDEYWGVPIKYTYIDDPYFCVRSEYKSIELESIDHGDFNDTFAYVLDSVNAVIESIWLGESASLEYDADGYLSKAWSDDFYVELIYSDSEPSDNVESEPVVYGSLDDMPDSFTFTSGAGAWATSLTIAEDWTFTGSYHDSNMEMVYICNFWGAFSEPVQVNDYTYSMALKSLNYEGTPNDEYTENGIRYIYSEPYGMDDAEEFLIYLPGAPIAELPEEFLSWAHINTEIRDTFPNGYYGIYNVGGSAGFVGMSENSFWNNTEYIYTYSGLKSALWPSYSRASHLVFWPESGASVIDIQFDWRLDEQTKFDGYDSRGNGSFSIVLDMNSDQSTVIIELTSRSRIDLTSWGGTTDGYLMAEYVKP